MVKLILDICQPLACGTFLVAGICCLILGKHHQGLINILFSTANFIVFYGNRFLK